MANESNLIPLNKRAKSAQRKIQSKGGKVSAEKRRERKKISEIYGDFLVNKHNIKFFDGVDDDGNPKYKEVEKEGVALVKDVLEQVLTDQRATAQSTRVSMLKEIREATEGNKSILMNPDGSELLSKGIKIEFEEPKE